MLAALVADEGDEEPFCILHAQNSKWKEGRGKREEGGWGLMQI